jgi:hypothetical protein
VAGFIVLSQIRLRLDNYPGAFPPDHLRSDKFTCTSNRVTSEESCPNNSASHTWSWVATANRFKAEAVRSLWPYSKRGSSLHTPPVSRLGTQE